ncbi:MAG: acyl-CoA dehydrogenase C-terminal domain-containing protein, partial [Gammaproteobacteria bacterium]|nr:acyl-CoA dehydrogenase C-terminal domain-containing protein [Gammaproteobacteria bacterium]
GIHGNATCALNFDGAIGYLLGDEDIGLKAMFTFMNLARLGTSFQGLAHCERGYQSAINYANERLQMRSLAGAKYPAMAADPIIVHPDVRRMVLHNKAMAEGLRAMLYRVSLTADLATYGKDAATRKAASKRLALMTPITKAFSTEQGIECASNAVQTMGGHGYIREWGVEQNLRDARIATIYEGTTGVQALDLLGRKVMADNGVELRGLLAEMLQSCDMSSHPMLAASLRREIEALQAVAEHVLAAALNNRDEIGAASVDFLMNCGYVIVAHEWLVMADLAQSKLGEGDDAFYQAKIDTARFYFAKVLPRTASLQACIYQGADSLMSHSALLTGDNL